MNALFTGSPIRAEAGEIESTKSPPNMSFAASGTEGAEATIVVRAWREDVRRVAVQPDAVGGVGAIKGTAVVRAVGHSAPMTKTILLPFHYTMLPHTLKIYVGEGIADKKVKLTSYTHAKTRTDPPSCIVPAANACRLGC